MRVVADVVGRNDGHGFGLLLGRLGGGMRGSYRFLRRDNTYNSFLLVKGSGGWWYLTFADDRTPKSMEKERVV